MLSFDNISFSYSEESPTVLKNITLDFKAGEDVCIMGANGSGKSSFAKIAAGLMVPDRGHVNIENNNDKKIPVGLIFQDPDNQMVAVVVENELAFALENIGYDKAEMDKLIAGELESFNIVNLRKRLTAELSGGEKQRVALASVMIFKPDILILDEPDSYLDEKGRSALYYELNKIKQAKPEMIRIHITQYPEVAMRYNRLVIFHNGEIVADDSPSTIFENEQFCYKTGLAYRFDDNNKVQLSSSQTREKSDALAMIELDRIGFSYPEQSDLFNRLSLQFNLGEAVGLVGYSGSGKSTLASLICGLAPVSSGEIRYYNHDGSELTKEQIIGQIGALFQQPEKQFFLSGCDDEIKFGPANLKMKLSEDEIDAFYNIVGLDRKTLGSRDPFSLSGGEKRRLAFAAVLAMSPEFVIFDEPTCGLDPEGVGRFVELVDMLKLSGHGIIIISHDGQLLRRLTDRIVLLDQVNGCSQYDSSSFFDDPDLRTVVSPSNY